MATNKTQFIVFEGIDGSGKTAQIQAVAEWLKSGGESVVVTGEPGATNLGAYLRNVLAGEHQGLDICPEAELLLFAADRIQHVKEVIAPALLAGNIVLCDRFTASTTAYQGYGRGINKRLVNQVNRISSSGLVPDLTIYFDLDVETALNRIAARGGGNSLDREKAEFYQRVRTGYRNSLNSTPNYAIIHANPSRGVVFEQVTKAISSWIFNE